MSHHRPLLLDLFCGAGGAAMGYHRAGFDVIGVDIAAQPRFPFMFIRGNAMELLAEFGAAHLDDVDFIHASPPCQAYSILSKTRPGLAQAYPDLIGLLRGLLVANGRPYVIENVPGAPLANPVLLCGSMFGMETAGPPPLQVRRHRLFEASIPLPAPPACAHRYRALPVYGHGAPGNREDLRGLPVGALQRTLMGIDWMNRDELAESIPPAYTQWLGNAIITAMGWRRVLTA